MALVQSSSAGHVAAATEPSEGERQTEQWASGLNLFSGSALTWDRGMTSLKNLVTITVTEHGPSSWSPQHPALGDWHGGAAGHTRNCGGVHDWA